MIVTRQKLGEAVLLDDHITVKVLQIRAGRVVLGIAAPNGVTIERIPVDALCEPTTSDACATGEP